MSKNNNAAAASSSIHGMLLIPSQAATAPAAKVDGSEAEQLIAQYGCTSRAIRALFAIHNDRGLVAKMLNKRYQHVRNVLITPIGK